MYDFKLLPEALRAAGFALVVFLLTTFASFNFSEVTDWKTWGISLGSGAIAAAAAGALAVLTRNRTDS
jgi:hypothetical protein